ncbi:hypothetical protein HN51_043113 [Arachis hypogaea]|uniref:Uncharacterized protein n=1 Tax=Arachis hypogaea TaxID=3818 RepID=A0A444Y7B4_ARAHY|nr:intracellular protein transport protein USO1 [Arachis ipaensis]XP_025669774.1 intracellular protein transport protein USO1-like [Arachis hypogaea]QHN95240.1 uncharacterized protein DS421_18g607840 [Arachis hypogaea]RYQ97785.1 hypothetical protein Ahy_B08g093863 isoform A [Arachis hypogaea]
MSSCHTSNLKHKNNHNNSIIRKRACSFSSTTNSSSSSSLVGSYPFKRAILVRKTRKTRSPSMAAHLLHGVPSKERELYMSARKLAATLWEINDLPPSRVEKELESEPIKAIKDKSVGLLRSGLLKPRISDPSYTHFYEGIERLENKKCKRRVSASSHQFHLANYFLEGMDDAHSTLNFIEEGNQIRNKKNCAKCRVGFKNPMKEARNGISTCKKLLKVLNDMCIQEQQSSSIPLILAMRSELDRVRNQIDQLIQDQGSNQNDMECLMKNFAEEKAAWRRRERERIREAITSIAQDLEVEKKLRRQTEKLNKKIAREMAGAKASYLKVSKDLEREKRAKEILQQVCDELAKGIGEDREQVEKLKRESAKVRQEVEKEREMLQLADILREERVQMKLSEAKYQFEEKNALLENLRNELEGFIRTKEEENGDVDVNPELKRFKDLESYLNTSCWEFQNPVKDYNGLDDGDDSDLQSIELNMDNDNKSYKWSYACENDAQERVSVEKDRGRRSISEKIQWGSICFNKGSSSCKKRDIVTINIQGSSDQCNGEKSTEFLYGAERQDDYDEEEEENEGNVPITSLRDCLSCVSPAKGRVQPLNLQCINGEAEGHNLKQEVAGRKFMC